MWPLYLTAGCVAVALGVADIMLMIFTVVAFRDKKKLYTRAERWFQLGIGSTLSLVLTVFTYAYTYAMLNVCDYAKC